MTTDKEQQVKANAKVFGGVVAIFIFFYFYCGSDHSEPPEKKVYDQTDAIIESHQFVLKRLRSPSTADFNYDQNAIAEKINDTTYYIRNSVDSQNGFGAIIRSEYSCYITMHPYNQTVHCGELKINSR